MLRERDWIGFTLVAVHDLQCDETGMGKKSWILRIQTAENLRGEGGSSGTDMEAVP